MVKGQATLSEDDCDEMALGEVSREKYKFESVDRESIKKIRKLILSCLNTVQKTKLLQNVRKEFLKASTSDAPD